MHPLCIHTKTELEPYLLSSPHLHLYAIGDLDDFFWPYTTWYAHRQGGEISQLLLVYSGTTLPTLLGLSEPPLDGLKELLAATRPFLPRRFYAHFSGDAARVLQADYQIESYGPHWKMSLVHPERLESVDMSAVSQLGEDDLPALERLYAASYPGNWFDPRMLQTGCYFGVRAGQEILSAAGIHVYSPRYRVAALGNITTLPDRRGQGLGAAVTARLCQHLLQSVDVIGLNVKTDNLPARRTYSRLGFEPVAEYEEYLLTAM